MANRPSNRARNLWTVEQLGVAADDRVLEIGCGPGLALAAAAAKATRGKIIGLDHSETMINQARRRNRKAIDDGRMELVVGGLERFPELAGAFDKVYSVNVVQFLRDRAAVFGALYSVLRPGGVIATTYMPRHKHATRSDARKIADEVSLYMQAAGFAAIRVEELPLKPVPAVCVIGNRPSQT
jgi:cyclopropane fatty-acyl-phospholipid synthase-like methyltransferase